MTYKNDKDLEFLANVPSEDMDTLVKTLTHDKDGKLRITEELTKDPEYIKNHPDHVKYWQLVAGELQRYGGNTFVTLARGGQGVEYREILCDVCDKLDVNYNKKSSTEIIENNLIQKLIVDSIEKMTPEELQQMAQELGVNNYGALTKDAAIATFITIFRAGGFQSYKIMFTVINMVLKVLIGRGLPFVWAPILAKTTKFLVGPIGWVVTGVWTAFDIASPAYRVTIPAVIQIIALRRKQLIENLEKQS